MDLDAPEGNSYDPIELFDTSPGNIPWRTSKLRLVHTRRAQMSDVLIFDILLASGGIRQPHLLYPPTDRTSVQKLLTVIEESTYDSLKKDCLIYYLLKWYEDGRDEAFSVAKCIPPQFIALADAYWHLDTGINIGRAVSLLSDARLNRDYPSKIIQALSSSSTPSELIRKYVRTAKPLLTEPDDIDSYTVALADSSLMEAWLYQRTYPESSETRPRLIRKIITWCLSPKPRSKPLTQLLAFPISNFEQSILHAFATSPPADLPPNSIPVVQDLVVLRLVQGGQYAAAVKLDHQLRTQSSSTASVTELSRKSESDRKQMIDEILAVMPVVERQLLEIELEALPTQKRPADLSASTSSNISAGDLSMSWEHIRPPTSSGAPKPNSSSAKPKSGLVAADTHVQPIPQRSGAPRFGGAPQPNGSAAAVAAARTAFPLTSSLSSSSRAGVPPLSSGPSVQERRSLFESVGSANRTKNAFYDPSKRTSPPPVTGVALSNPSANGNGTIPVKRPAPRTQPYIGEEFMKTSKNSGKVFGAEFGTAALQADTSNASARQVLDLLEEGGQKGESGDDVDIEMEGEDLDTSYLQTKGKEKAQAKEQTEPNSKDKGKGKAKEVQQQPRQVKDEGGADRMEDEGASFDVSLFSPPPNSSSVQVDSKPRSGRGVRLAKTETQIKMPPGAFFPDEDEPLSPVVIQAPPVAAVKPKSRAVPPLPSNPTPSKRGPGRPRKSVKKEDHGRSLPGSLIPESDDEHHGEEEEAEEEDVVPPLPISTATSSRRQSTRKPRASTSEGSKTMRRKKGKDEAPVQRLTRRSSRLSTATTSERASSSERDISISPVKNRRAGRSSTAGQATSSVSAAGKSKTSAGRKQR